MALCPHIAWSRPLRPASMLSSWTLLPPPKVESKWPFAWDLVWWRQWTSGLSPLIVDRYFILLHNILSLKGRLASLREVVEGLCSHCGGCKDVSNFFWHCPCVVDLWNSLYVKMWCQAFSLIWTCLCWPF
jgi:hypothetical protein